MTTVQTRLGPEQASVRGCEGRDSGRVRSTCLPRSSLRAISARLIAGRAAGRCALVVSVAEVRET